MLTSCKFTQKNQGMIFSSHDYYFIFKVHYLCHFRGTQHILLYTVFDRSQHFFKVFLVYCSSLSAPISEATIFIIHDCLHKSLLFLFLFFSFYIFYHFTSFYSFYQIIIVALYIFITKDWHIAVTKRKIP